MNITFETVLELEKYIEQKDMEAMKKLMEKAAENANKNRYSSEDVDTYMLMLVDDIVDFVLVYPELVDDEISEQIYKIINEMQDTSGDARTVFFSGLRKLVMSYAPERFGYIEAVLRIIKNSHYYGEKCFIGNVIATAAGYNDTELFRYIADRINDSSSEISSHVRNNYTGGFEDWVWIFLDHLIRNQYGGLLDKVIPVLYNGKKFTEIRPAEFSTNFSWVSMVMFLYGRYNPEVAKIDVGRELIGSGYFSQNSVRVIFVNNEYSSMLSKELEIIYETGARIKNLNDVFCVMFMLGNSVCESVCRLSEDKVLFYLNDSCLTGTSKSGIFKNLREKGHDVEFCIDNCRYFKVTADERIVSLAFKNNFIAELLQEHRLVLNDRIKDNVCLDKLVQSDARVLYTLLKNLDIDKERSDDLIELCIRHKNTNALEYLNKTVNIQEDKEEK